MAYQQGAPGAGSVMTNPIKGGLSTEHAAAALTVGALVLLWLIGRGFRGVGAFGASVSVR